jgi:hypothetical protein
MLQLLIDAEWYAVEYILLSPDYLQGFPRNLSLKKLYSPSLIAIQFIDANDYYPTGGSIEFQSNVR